MGIQLLGILFFHLCDVAELAAGPEYSLAKFGYKLDMKVNKFEIPSHFLASC
jgi:hypothetical protein